MPTSMKTRPSVIRDGKATNVDEGHRDHLGHCTHISDVRFLTFSVETGGTCAHVGTALTEN